MPLDRLDHVLVLTDDIEATRTFYRDALGLVVGERPPFAFSGYWLYVDGTPCVHVADRERVRGALRAPRSTGAARPSITSRSVAADYDELAARLEAAGIDAVANEVPGRQVAPALRDRPNGVRVELNVPRRD